MNETLDVFPQQPARRNEIHDRPLSAAQREEIRTLFAVLGETTAIDQYATVAVLTGVKLRRVSDLTEKKASVLIQRLREREASRNARPAGAAWADRSEDTWIDLL